MSVDVRRAPLISFGPQKQDEKSAKKVHKTVRISVNLPESTEDKCPEFNYKDELAVTKRKHEKGETERTNGAMGPLNEHDEDVKRIAAEMEAKYGMGLGKARKSRKDDYADIGMGYDETDSFIDNTDGYDEIIPKNVTTLHGGFYINCGALEFKTDDEATLDGISEDEVRKENRTSRKRILQSSTESEEGDEETDLTNKLVNPEKKHKLSNNRNTMQRALKKRLFSHDKIKQIRKKRQQHDAKMARDSLKQKKVNDVLQPHVVVPAERIPDERVSEHTQKVENRKSLLPIQQDNVAKELIACKRPDDLDDGGGSSSRESTLEAARSNNKSIVDNSSDSNDGKSNKLVDVVIVKLPENLSSDIVQLVDEIKKAAARSTEGKVRFFSGHVNSMLLNLERKCRCLGRQSRLRVYEHLAPFVKCRKETLIKRAKNLILVDDLDKVQSLIKKLKVAVDLAMPILLERYEIESKKILDKKFSKETLFNEELGALRLPKRRFVWTDEIKKSLKDVLTLRKKCCMLEGRKKDAVDEYLTTFLKAEILVLWPEGWMSMGTLLKFCSIEKAVVKEANITSTNPLRSAADTAAVSNSAQLTITPIIANAPTTNTYCNDANEIEIKYEEIKRRSSSPEVEIVKYNNDRGNVLISQPIKSEPATEEKSDPPEVKVTTTVKGDVSIKTESVDNPFAHQQAVIKLETKPESVDTLINHQHCQIVDLTDQQQQRQQQQQQQPCLKRKPGPKSKTKYYYEYPPDVSKRKEQSVPSTDATLFNKPAPNPSSNEPPKFGQQNSNSDLFSKTVKKAEVTNCEDHFQKVMEDLIVLQKMQIKPKEDEFKNSSSPVSVIAFNNKSRSSDSNNVTPLSVASSRNSGFQDAFQKRFVPDFNVMMKATHTPLKNTLNSVPKPVHASGSSNGGGGKSEDRIHQTVNSNYPQRGISKVRSSSSQQPGSYNLVEDMFSILLNQYECSKAANAKPGS